MIQISFSKDSARSTITKPMSEKSNYQSIRNLYEQMNSDLEKDPDQSLSSLKEELESQNGIQPDPDGLEEQALDGLPLIENELNS